MSLQSRILALANAIASDVKNKQARLISQTNIKSVNNTSILGNGNLNVLGSRTIVFGGTGTSTTGSNLTPLLSTNFSGHLVKWRLSCKNAPSGGAFTISVYSSTSEELTGRVLLFTASIPQNTKTNTGTINIAIASDIFLTLDIDSVNSAGDWKLELRQDET